MKKTSIILLVLLAAFAFASVAIAQEFIVSHDYIASTNGASYSVGLPFVPKFVTAYGATGDITVKRIHAGYTNTLGTVASSNLNTSVSWGALVEGDTIVVTGTGMVEVQGER